MEPIEPEKTLAQIEELAKKYRKEELAVKLNVHFNTIVFWLAKKDTPQHPTRTNQIAINALYQETFHGEEVK